MTVTVPVSRKIRKYADLYGVHFEDQFISAHDGPCAAWATCQVCHRPFEIPTGFWWIVNDKELRVEDVVVHGGPCPRCWERGDENYGVVFTSLLREEEDQLVIAGSEENALRALAWVSQRLQDDLLSLSEAAVIIRRDAPSFSAFADRIEQHPVGTALAGVVLSAIITAAAVGVAAITGGDDDRRPAEIQQIIHNEFNSYGTNDNPRQLFRPGRPALPSGGDRNGSGSGDRPASPR